MLTWYVVMGCKDVATRLGVLCLRGGLEVSKVEQRIVFCDLLFRD